LTQPWSVVKSANGRQGCPGPVRALHGPKATPANGQRRSDRAWKPLSLRGSPSESSDEGSATPADVAPQAAESHLCGQPARGAFPRRASRRPRPAASRTAGPRSGASRADRRPRLRGGERLPCHVLVRAGHQVQHGRGLSPCHPTPVGLSPRHPTAVGLSPCHPEEPSRATRRGIRNLRLAVVLLLARSREGLVAARP